MVVAGTVVAGVPALVGIGAPRKRLMVDPERFERPTLWFVAKCSIQLSYGSTCPATTFLEYRIRRAKATLLTWLGGLRAEREEGLAW